MLALRNIAAPARRQAIRQTRAFVAVQVRREAPQIRGWERFANILFTNRPEVTPLLRTERSPSSLERRDLMYVCTIHDHKLHDATASFTRLIQPLRHEKRPIGPAIMNYVKRNN